MHVGKCAYHMELPRWAAQIVHERAAQEDVEAGDGTLATGTPGANEWERAAGAIKWWPRWIQTGEAFLAAIFYLQWGDQVQICVEWQQPGTRLGQSPWDVIAQELGAPVARLALSLLALRSMAAELDTEVRRREGLAGDELACLVEPDRPYRLAGMARWATQEGVEALEDLKTAADGKAAGWMNVGWVDLLLTLCGLCLDAIEPCARLVEVAGAVQVFSHLVTEVQPGLLADVVYGQGTSK
jgi:hypothetical protein